MKKVFLSLLTIIYMTVSSGMAMEIHFCMGEKTGTDFYTRSGDTCGRCGMKERKGGCCSHEQKFIKLSDDHKTVSSHYTAPNLLEAILTLPLVSRDNTGLSFQSWFPYQNIADSGPPLYILNRVFRI